MKQNRTTRLIASVVTGLLLSGFVSGVVYADESVISPSDEFVAVDRESATTIKYGNQGAKPSNSAHTITVNSKESIQAAIDKAEANTTIIIKGEHSELLKIRKDNITLKGESAVLNGKGQQKYGDLIDIKASNIVIDGLELTEMYIVEPSDHNAGAVRINPGSNNVYILNCDIHHVGCEYNYDFATNPDARNDFNGHGISVKGSKDAKTTNITISNNKVHNLTTGRSECVVLNNNVEYFTIANNYIYDNDNIGIDCAGGYKFKEDKKNNPDVNEYRKFDWSRNGEVCGNYVSRISSKIFENPGYLDDDGKPHAGADGIYVDGGRDIYIHDNYVTGCDIGIEVASENHGWTAEGIIVERNQIVYNDQYVGFAMGGSNPDSNGIATGNIIRYNTIVSREGKHCLVIKTAVGNTFSNNILISTDDKEYVNNNYSYYSENTFENNAVCGRINKKTPDAFINTTFFDCKVSVDNNARKVTVSSSTDLSAFGHNGGGAAPTATTKPTATTAPTATKKPTSTPKPTVTPTKKPTATPKPTSTPKPTVTPTKKPTVTPTKKPTVTPTKKPTATPKPTSTPKPTATPKATATPKPTKAPTATPTKRPTATPRPTSTPRPTATPKATATPKPTATPRPTRVPTVKPTNTPTAVPSLEPTATVTPVPTFEAKVTEELTATPTCTVAPCVMGEEEAEATPVPVDMGGETTPAVTTKATITSEPAETGTPTIAVTATPTPTPVDPKTQIRAFVDRIYINVLDREPEKDGAEFWCDQLYTFKATGAEVGLMFVLSDEFTKRGVSDDKFLEIMYTTFFDRAPEQNGMDYWKGELISGSKTRADVAYGFIYSQEWADTCASYGIRSGGSLKPECAIAPTDLTYAFVERMYTTAMKRGYDENGRQYWAALLANFETTGEQVGASFFLSDEMASYKLSDKEFLNRLYATFMDRESDADGSKYWLDSMAKGMTRADVVYGFTRSPEFTDKCVEARILPY